MKRIRVVGTAGQENWRNQEWLKSYTDTPDGRGLITFTTDPAQAMLFASAEQALRYYRQQSKSVPKRTDGKPNRPLTAYTVEIEEATTEG